VPNFRDQYLKSLCRTIYLLLPLNPCKIPNFHPNPFTLSGFTHLICLCFVNHTNFILECFDVSLVLRRQVTNDSSYVNMLNCSKTIYLRSTKNLDIFFQKNILFRKQESIKQMNTKHNAIITNSKHLSL